MNRFVRPTMPLMEGADVVVESSIDSVGAPLTELRPVQRAQGIDVRWVVRDGAHRHSLVPSGHAFPQAFWPTVSTDRRDAKAVWGPKVH